MGILWRYVGAEKVWEILWKCGGAAVMWRILWKLRKNYLRRALGSLESPLYTRLDQGPYKALIYTDIVGALLCTDLRWTLLYTDLDGAL